MSSGALFLAVFLACVVEAVEALTIVLAAGTGRDWRSAITGASNPSHTHPREPAAAR